MQLAVTAHYTTVFSNHVQFRSLTEFHRVQWVEVIWLGTGDGWYYPKKTDLLLMASHSYFLLSGYFSNHTKLLSNRITYKLLKSPIRLSND